MRTWVIAEAGLNHNGSLKLAKRLVDAAKESGADVVKFQTVKPEMLVSKFAPKAEYQRKTTGEESQLEMIKKLVLSYEEFRTLQRYCGEKNILFASTPFDQDSIEFLKELEMPFWKIPSGEITNLPYLEKIGKLGEKVILSTGMCELWEIEQAVEILKKNGTYDITLLHCNTEYPTPYQDVNLRAMKQMKEKTGLPVGYSDHTRGLEVSIAAAALGAVVIEKHFTLDRYMEGPDHRASLEPEELKDMVRAIRNVEAALGSPEKRVSESERNNIRIARKSIVARVGIARGELLTEENLSVKRPGDGISPMKWYEMLGTRAKRDYREDEQIE